MISLLNRGKLYELFRKTLLCLRQQTIIIKALSKICSLIKKQQSNKKTELRLPLLEVQGTAVLLVSQTSPVILNTLIPVMMTIMRRKIHVVQLQD